MIKRLTPNYNMVKTNDFIFCKHTKLLSGSGIRVRNQVDLEVVNITMIMYTWIQLPLCTCLTLHGLPVSAKFKANITSCAQPNCPKQKSNNKIRFSKKKKITWSSIWKALGEPVSSGGTRKKGEMHFWGGKNPKKKCRKWLIFAIFF